MPYRDELVFRVVGIVIGAVAGQVAVVIITVPVVGYPVGLIIGIVMRSLYRQVAGLIILVVFLSGASYGRDKAPLGQPAVGIVGIAFFSCPGGNIRYVAIVIILIAESPVGIRESLVYYLAAPAIGQIPGSTVVVAVFYLNDPTALVVTVS